MTLITDFRVRPVRPKYAKGQDVVFSGTLKYGFLFKQIRVPGLRRISIISDEVEAGVGYTKDGPEDPERGNFLIAVRLPFSTGIYIYRALFEGCNWIFHAWWPVHLDTCLSDFITLEVAEDVPPPPPAVPPWTGITAKQAYHNYLLEGEHFMGCFLGELREDKFYPIVYTVEGIPGKFCYGTLAGFQACPKGSAATVDVPTFSLPCPGSWDSFAWVGGLKERIRVLFYEDRIVGIDGDDLPKFVWYDVAAFKDVVEII